MKNRQEERVTQIYLLSICHTAWIASDTMKFILPILLTGTDAGLQTVSTSSSSLRTFTPQAITGGSCLQPLRNQL